MDRAGWTRCRTSFTELFKTKTRAEWDEVLLGSDACYAPVLTMSEATNDAHMKARKTIIERDGVPQPAPAPRFSRTRGRSASVGAVARPAHRRSAGATGASTGAAVAKLRESGAIAISSRHGREPGAPPPRRGRGVGHGDVADLAPRARRLAVVVEMRAGDAEHASRSGIAPMQFTIALGPRAAVEPSGRPRIARRWFSNWLVSAPSIVQCPELCTRGAISFATTSPPTSNSSTQHDADVVELVEQGADRGLGARLERSVEIGRGRERQPEDAVAVMVLDRGPARDFAVAAAHREDRQLAVERDEPFEDARHLAQLYPRAVEVGAARASTTWPLPS